MLPPLRLLWEEHRYLGLDTKKEKLVCALHG
jgi:hypothetical protein